MNTTIPQIPAKPLEKIALSCSGGGYRAASFHLGSMSYLHRLQYKGKPLLENVKMLSTVSGGTISGAVYALQKQQGKSFEEIYHFLLDNLSKLDMITMGVNKLNPDAEWKATHKRKNLINAFAELYDMYFTKGETMSAFDHMDSHLDAVSFNSTEFKNAINFRFRNKGSEKFGNNENKVSQEAGREVKIADAMAASSAFPGGFEPIVWPVDFMHGNAGELKKSWEGKPSVGLMDGGIYDNQGIDSILLYKKTEHPYFDLIIISDVTSPYMNPFKASSDGPKTGFRAMTVKQLLGKAKIWNRWAGIGLLATVAVLIGIPLSTSFSHTFLNGLLIGLAALPIVLLLLKWAVVSFIKKIPAWIIKKIKTPNSAFYIDSLANLDIDALSVRRVLPLLADRINSLLSLLLDVFLKVVRRLNYYKVYNDKVLAYRRMSVLIRELTEEDFCNAAKRPAEPGTTSPELLAKTVVKGKPFEEAIGPAIKKVAEFASSFGTTLWFTKDNQLDDMLGNLVACGQSTMCYNMVIYLETLLFVPGNGFEQLDQQTKDELNNLFRQCVADWNQFKNNPKYLLEAMSRSNKLA